jgi:hypothetical protein
MNHVVCWLAFGMALGAAACGSSSGGGSQDETAGNASDGTGGAVATEETGGASGKGGGSPSGGAVASGGRAATGGSVEAGGASETGGRAATGGRATTGGLSGTGGRRATGGASATGGRQATGGSPASAGAPEAGGGSEAGGVSATGGASASGAGSETAGSSGAVDTPIPTQCTSALPAGATPVDVSEPTTVVGSGTAQSCTFEELQDAVAQAGIITFDCGEGPATIAVTETLELSTEEDTVIDGGGKVTLDGRHEVQIMNYNHPDWMVLETRVTLQHLRVINGKTTPVEVIPEAPAPCSQGYNDGEGGAIFMRDGNLTVIDCTFSGNQAAPLGPDTGGGAIYINGSKHGVLIVDSVFTDNSGANAGAVGGLFAELQIYNSLFQNNKATGNGANNDDEELCPDHINNGQHEVGSGGNGGAIYQDGGASTNVVLCGVAVLDNAAGEEAFGGGVFMTSNDWSGSITLRDSVITGNTGRSWTIIQDDGGMDLGSAFGVNAKSATVENSTLQDM